MTLRRATPALVLVGCLGGGALSLLTSAMPHYDAWGWIVWGREIVDPHRVLMTLGGPSWKPLPVLFTTLFAPFGGVAPDLWLVVSRAGGLLALVLAFVLARRFGGVLAGVLAAIFLALSQGWLLELSWGAADPLLVAAVLGAVICHLDGRHERALLALLAAALVRPEAWPFLGCYAVWAWRTGGARRPVIAGVVLAVPVLWLGPDWYSSGDPFYGSRLARQSGEARHARREAAPILGMLRRTGGVLALPVWVAALAAVGLAVRRRERTVLGIAALAAAWIALVALMTVLGYAGLGRFSLAAAALGCVLAGWAIAQALTWIPGAAATGFLAVAMAALFAPFVLRSGDHAVKDVRTGGGGRPILASLRRAIERAGGAGHLRGYPVALINGALEPALAWDLGVPMRRVHGRPVGGVLSYLVFVSPSSDYAGTPPPWHRRGTRRTVLAEDGSWKVVEVTPAARARPRRPASGAA